MYKNLREVYDAVSVCRGCELCKTRTNPVFGEGSLKAKLMFVGEGPGADEDRTGRPFVGKAGQLLDKMIAAIGLKREEVYIANVVKCRPPGNADPKEAYAAACIPYLREQVRYIHPRLIVLLGRIATKYLLGTETGMGKIHGNAYEKKGFLFVPTYHPSALLRNPDLKHAAWEDFKKIREFYDHEPT